MDHKEGSLWHRQAYAESAAGATWLSPGKRSWLLSVPGRVIRALFFLRRVQVKGSSRQQSHKEGHMDRMDNVRERIEALEQQMRAMGAHTRTVERRRRGWWGIACGFLILGLMSLSLPSGTAQEDPATRTRRS